MRTFHFANPYNIEQSMTTSYFITANYTTKQTVLNGSLGMGSLCLCVVGVLCWGFADASGKILTASTSGRNVDSSGFLGGIYGC